MEKLRAGIIGLGFIGMQHVDAIMRVPQAQLAAVSSGSAEKARAVSAVSYTHLTLPTRMPV